MSLVWYHKMSASAGLSTTYKLDQPQKPQTFMVTYLELIVLEEVIY